MKPTILVALTALVVFPETPDLAAPKDLEFDVAEGTALDKTFSEKTRWTLLDFQRLIDGNEMGGDTPEMNAEVATKLEVRDEYGATVDGRPARLERAVEVAEGDAASSIATGGLYDDFEVELKSPAADATVTFEWNRKEQEYEVTTEDEVRDDWLRGLEEDMDYRCLLPDEAVAEGDTWKIDASELEQMLSPGGDWALLPVAMPRGDYEVLAPEDVFASICATLGNPVEELEGEAVVTWAETRETDGRQLAVIEIEFEAAISSDLGERIQAMGEEVGYRWSRSETLYLLEWDLEGEGQLVWDLDAGHFDSFTFEATSAVTIELSWVQDMGAGESDLAIIADVTATSKLEASAVVAEEEED